MALTHSSLPKVSGNAMPLAQIKQLLDSRQNDKASDEITRYARIAFHSALDQNLQNAAIKYYEAATATIVGPTMRYTMLVNANKSADAERLMRAAGESVVAGGTAGGTGTPVMYTPPPGLLPPTATSPSPRVVPRTYTPKASDPMPAPSALVSTSMLDRALAPLGKHGKIIAASAVGLLALLIFLPKRKGKR
jgi:hypothetical protein